TVASLADQKFLEDDVTRLGPFEVRRIRTSNHVASQDTQSINAQNVRTAHTGTSSQTYVVHDSAGRCFSRSLSSTDSVLTGFQYGRACFGGRQHWDDDGPLMLLPHE